MALNDETYAEAVRATYYELALRLHPADRERFTRTPSDEGLEDIVAFIKDNPPEGQNAFHEAMAKMEQHLREKFPAEEYEVETVGLQIRRRIGV